jgi:hypothetical protein
LHTCSIATTLASAKCRGLNGSPREGRRGDEGGVTESSRRCADASVIGASAKGSKAESVKWEALTSGMESEPTAGMEERRAALERGNNEGVVAGVARSAQHE